MSSDTQFDSSWPAIPVLQCFPVPIVFCRAVNTWRGGLSWKLRFHPTTVNRHNAMKDTVLIRMTEYHHCSCASVANGEKKNGKRIGGEGGIFTRSDIGFFICTGLDGW